MILDVNYCFGLIKLREVYFEKLSNNNHFESGADIIRFVQCKGSKIQVDENFLSTSISLSMSDQDIFNKFKKGLRYDIRKEIECVSKKDFVFHNPNTVSIKELNSLFGYLNTFQASRHLPHVNKHKLKKLALLKKLAISFVNKDDKILNYHVYLFDEPLGKVRLLYSFNVNSGSLPVNKAHTWFDIQMFQAMGLREYDFGGISNFDQPNGIDKFKLSFGGTRDKYHTSYKACSKLGRIILAVKGL
jgi:hypothetical protein